MIVGGGTPDTTNKEYWDGGSIQWFTPSEVGKEKYVSNSERQITALGLKNSSAKLLPAGSILLSSRATVGECSINLTECCTNQGFQSFIPDKSIVSTEFLYYRLQTLRRNLIRKACGSTFLEISASQIAKMVSSLPQDNEQNRVSSFLSLIDQRIALQNKVIERYESLIKAITKRLVRCKGQLCLLGDIADIYQPRTITGLDMSISGKYPVFGANGIIGYYADYNHALPQICIACRGNTCGALNYSLPFSWITGNSMVINVDSSSTVNKRFLFHLLSTIDYTPLISGSGQPQIVRGPLQKLRITLPEKNDQDKIANVIDCLLERLIVENTILRYSQLQKRFLLARLFI